MAGMHRWPGRDAAAGLLILIFGSHCTFETPQQPSWDVQLSIPLVNKTYTMQELIDSEDRLITGSGKNILYHLDEDLESQGIKEFMHFEDIDTSQAIPVIPVLQDTVWHELVLNESMIVEECELRQGSLNVGITNNTDLDIDLIMVFPFLYVGVPAKRYAITAKLAPGETYSQPAKDLAGALVKPPIINGKNVVQYGVYASYDAQPFSNLPDVTLDIHMHDMVFQRLRGGLDDLVMPMDTKQDSLNLPDELEGMMLGQVDATLYVYSSFDNLPVDVDITVLAKRDDGTEGSLSFELKDLQSGVDPADTSTWNTYPIQGLENILNLYPEILEIHAEAHVGNGYDPANPQEIQFDDSLSGFLSIDVPIVFQFPAGWKNEMPVDTLGSDSLYEDGKYDDETQSRIDLARNNVNSAGIVVLAENHFPFGAKVTLIFSKTRGDSTIYSTTDPGDFVKVLNLQPAQTGGGDGSAANPNLVTAAVESRLNLVMEPEEVTLFESPEVYIGTRIEFHATNQMVKVDPADYLTIKARAEASFNTKIPEDEDNAETGGEL